LRDLTHTKSLHDMSLMLEGGSPPTGRTHEGGMSKLRNVAEQERPDIIIVEGSTTMPANWPVGLLRIIRRRSSSCCVPHTSSSD
jgi:hypothetical protein